MKIVGIIPDCLASTRFPNKPLAPILGMPMIGHVFCRSRLCRSLHGVYVATCDDVIARYFESIGGKAVMTAATHEHASDTKAEAVEILERDTKTKIHIVVMIQGDEPVVTLEMIDAAVAPLIEDESILVSNLMGRIHSVEEFEDPNEIKVVVDKNSYALYFSRQPIPTTKKGGGLHSYVEADLCYPV